MSKKQSIFSMPYIPLVLATTALWFGGSAWWYVCQTQELCGTTQQEAKAQPAAEKEPIKEDAVVVQPQEEKPTPVEVEEPVKEPSPEPVKPADTFDTTQTVTALFNPNQATFAGTSWENDLNDIADYLKDNPSKSVEVAGYAAQVTNDVNEDSLSRNRAQALAKFLISKGVAADQVDVVVKAYKEPVGDNTTEAGRAKNRRAVLRFN